MENHDFPRIREILRQPPKLSNMACRDGFPSRRLVSSNTPLAPRRKSWLSMPGNYLDLARGYLITGLVLTVGFGYPPVRLELRP